MKSSKDGTVGYAPVAEIDPRLRQVIEDYWDSIFPILYSRTKLVLNTKWFRGVRGGAVPGGNEVEDFIQEAVSEACDALPEWDWDGEWESLVKFLWKLISLHIRRCAECAEAQELRSTTNPAEASAHVADVSKVEQECYEGPEEFTSEREEVDYILKMFYGRRDYKIIEVIFREEVSMPEEIAERLGLGVGEVNNAKKRLRRDPYLLSLKRKSGGKKERGWRGKLP
jgi:hypothetical protein